jgi:glutamine synthetase
MDRQATERQVALLKQLREQQIEFVRVLFCDNANVIRAKAFHREQLAEHFESGVSFTVAQQAMPVMMDCVVPATGLAPVGEVWLVPDWQTFQRLPYAPTHASVIGDMVQGQQPWPLCPRFFLKRLLAQAAELGLTIKAAFENEFYLLKSTPEGPHPTDHTVFAASWGMDQNRGVIDDITRALIAQGIPVERYYPESGPGQQEISTQYTEALLAADRQLRFRETVRGVAWNHGLMASFMPKIFADQAGSGCHLHLSLWQEGQNIVYDPDHPGQLSLPAQQFMAGILTHLPALMALTTPSVNSYRRLAPHFWSGAFRAWGWDNREAALRVPSNFSAPSPTHFELKTLDASANPYLALGAVIVAGLDGLHQARPLGEPIQVDPGILSLEERQARGIDRLPANLGESLGHLRQNQVLNQALGPELAQAFIAVRQAEWEAMQDQDLKQERAILLGRY